MRKRKHFTGAWLNDEEFYRMQYLCSKTGLSKDCLIRKMIAGKELRERVHPDYKELIWHMDKIGNNLNQIARKVNSKNTINESDMEAVKEDVKKMRWEIDRWKYKWQ